MRLTRVQVEKCQRAPKGYGFAWRDFDTRNTVAYPIPFNVIFRGFRRLWHWVIGGFVPSVIDKARQEGYSKGYNQSCEEQNAVDEATERAFEKLRD